MSALPDVRPGATDVAPATSEAQALAALDAIDRVDTPEAADVLLRTITAYQAAVRLARIGREHEHRWATVRLRAERKMGELLGPPENAGKRSDLEPVSDAHGLTDAERTAQKEARKIAAVPADVFSTYLEAAEEPTRAGLLRTVTDAKRQQRDAHRASQATNEPTLDIREGRFQDVLTDVADDSVDLILTDPPYAAEHLELYADLGDFASRVLKPGGSLLAYAGQGTLPDVLDRLRGRLRYWWTLSLSHEHGGQQMIGKYVLIEWKPIVWFVKERRRDEVFVGDRVRGTKPRKSDHPWAQGSQEVAYLIDALTEPGELIVDPFSGSGSFGRAAVEMKRAFIGADLPMAVAA